MKVGDLIKTSVDTYSEFRGIIVWMGVWNDTVMCKIAWTDGTQTMEEVEECDNFEVICEG